MPCFVIFYFPLFTTWMLKKNNWPRILSCENSIRMSLSIGHPKNDLLKNHMKKKKKRNILKILMNPLPMDLLSRRPHRMRNQRLRMTARTRICWMVRVPHHLPFQVIMMNILLGPLVVTFWALWNKLPHCHPQALKTWTQLLHKRLNSDWHG